MMEVYLTPDGDLTIGKSLTEEEWKFLSERGHNQVFSKIIVKYSEVPDLLYFLGREVGVPEVEVPKEDRISLSGELLEDFLRRMENAKFRSRLWKLLDVYPDQIFIDDLRRLKELFPDCEHIGFVPESAEYPPVDILKGGGRIYLVQRDILPMNREETETVVGKIIEYYGATVSPVLRAFGVRYI